MSDVALPYDTISVFSAQHFLCPECDQEIASVVMGGRQIATCANRNCHAYAVPYAVPPVVLNRLSLSKDAKQELLTKLGHLTHRQSQHGWCYWCE